MGVQNSNLSISNSNRNRFVLKLFVFILPLSLLAYSKPLYLLYSKKYQRTVAGTEIYTSISLSKKKNNAKRLVLGESVARQMFFKYEDNDTINSLACNQAISMVGQFILLTNYIGVGNHIDVVYLVYNPFSFVNNLDQAYTFHYFLKPFFKSENYHLFTENVIKQIQKIPYYFLCREPAILTSNWTPNFAIRDDFLSPLITKDSIGYSFLSPITIEYLNKIKVLSIKEKFKFYILPTPTKLSNLRFVEQINKDEIKNAGFEDEFSYYFKNIIYINDTNFIDFVHLKMPSNYIDYYKNIILSN